MTVLQKADTTNALSRHTLNLWTDEHILYAVDSIISKYYYITCDAMNWCHAGDKHITK